MADDPAKGTKGAFDALGKTLMASIGPVGLLGEALSGFLEPMELIIDPLTMMGEILGTMLYPMLEPISGLLYSIMPLLQIAADFLGPILLFVSNLINPLSIIADGGQTLIPILNVIGAWFANVGGTISAAFYGVMDWFAGIGNMILSSIVNGFWVVINWFAALPQMILDAIISGASALGTGVSNWWNSLWD